MMMEKYIFLNKTADYNIIVQNDAVLTIYLEDF